SSTRANGWRRTARAAPSPPTNSACSVGWVLAQRLPLRASPPPFASVHRRTTVRRYHNLPLVRRGDGHRAQPYPTRWTHSAGCASALLSNLASGAIRPRFTVRLSPLSE